MSITSERLSQWKQEALDEQGVHMLVVTDMYESETFPVTVFPEDEILYEIVRWNSDKYHRVDSVHYLGD
jgi:hypothetical protein